MNYLALVLLLAASPTIERLPNGLTVVTEHRTGAPVTAVQLWVRAGVIDEVEETLGLSHFLEHMLFKGTTTRPVGSIHGEVEKNGGEINAATSDDWTYYHITIASEEAPRALDIILDIAQNATFPEVEVEREREVIKEEIARRDDNPSALLYDNLGRAAYTVHPYRWRVIGDSASLAKITRDVFVDYYRTHYVPEKMAVVVVGDLDSRAVRAKVDATLGRVPHSGRVFPEPPVEPPTTPRDIVIAGNTVRTYGTVSYPAPTGDDIRANAAGDLLVEILAGAGRRLQKRLVEQSKLADAIGVSFPTARDPSRFSITYVAPPANREVLEEEIRKEIRKLLIDGVTADEVFSAVDKFTRNRKLEHESSSSRASNLGFWFVIGRPELAAEYDSAINSLLPADITAFARKYLDERHAVTAAVVPRRAAIASLDTRIVIRRVPSDLVSVGFFFRGGQLTEPHPGWSALLAGVMNRGVLGMTHEEHQSHLASLGLAIGASSSSDMFSIIGTAEPERVGLLVQEMNNILSNPNTGDLEIVRKSLMDSLKTRADRPFDYALDLLNKTVYGSHSYSRPEAGDIPNLERATVEGLRKYVADLRAGERMVVVAAGNVSETPLMAALGEAEHHPDTVVRAIFVTEIIGPADVIETAPTTQTILFRAIRGPSIRDSEYAAWKVANAILGGRSSSRLFRIVREERGLAYAVGSFFPSRLCPSNLIIYAGTRPETVEGVRDLFDEALYPPTAEELEEAKRLIIGEFRLDHEQVARRAWYLGWYETLGLGASYDERYPEVVRAVSLDEITALFDRLAESPAVDVTYGAAAR